MRPIWAILTCDLDLFSQGHALKLHFEAFYTCFCHLDIIRRLSSVDLEFMTLWPWPWPFKVKFKVTAKICWKSLLAPSEAYLSNFDPWRWPIFSRSHAKCAFLAFLGKSFHCKSLQRHYRYPEDIIQKKTWKGIKFHKTGSGLKMKVGVKSNTLTLLSCL